MIAAIAQGLHLSLDERDHLGRLAGHNQPDQSHLLFVHTAVPGSESHEKLQLLSVIGAPALRS